MINKAEFGAQVEGVSQGRLPDGAASFASFAQSSSPGSSNWLPGPVMINEALSGSAVPLEDAIELFNPSDSAIGIGGWWLSDDASNLRKYQFSASTSIAAGGYLVVYENQFNATPGVGNNFSLSSSGDELYLSAVDGTGALTGYRAQVKFGAAAAGVSYGRIVTAGGAEFWPLVSRTFGQDSPADLTQFRLGTGLSNATAKIGPVIINEVMYHPIDIAGTPPLDNLLEEYVEIHNITTSRQDLSGWKLKGESDFTFASGTVIRPGEYLLLVAFDPSSDPVALNNFRTKYGVSSSTAIHGPYAPRLANGAQDVEIAYPGISEGGTTPYILVDKVSYTDASPWPIDADGGGVSLQRLSRTSIGNDAQNWRSAVPTPGNLNDGQSAIVDSDGDALPDTWEISNGFDRFDTGDARLDYDGDGQSNLAEYVSATDPKNAMSTLTASVTTAADGFHVRFWAAPGRGYTVFYGDTPAGPWLKLVDVPARQNEGAQEVIDQTDVSRRFYKIVTPPQ